MKWLVAVLAAAILLLAIAVGALAIRITHSSNDSGCPYAQPHDCYVWERGGSNLTSPDDGPLP